VVANSEIAFTDDSNVFLHMKDLVQLDALCFVITHCILLTVSHLTAFDSLVNKGENTTPSFI